MAAQNTVGFAYFQKKPRQILLWLLFFNAFLILLYVFFGFFPSASSLSASVLSGIKKGDQQAVLTAIQAAAPTSLDPQELNPEDMVAVGLIFEPLIRFDDYFNLVPAIASTWYWRDDTHLVTKLNSHALFHDGTKVSCDDVAASLTRARDYKKSSVKDYFSDVAVLAEGKDKQTCIFTLPQADRDFLRKLTRLYIIPAKLAVAAKDSKLADLNGSGLYRLTASDKTGLTFEIFTKHLNYSVDLPKKFVIRVEPQKYRRLALVRDGSADILLDTPAMFARQIKKWGSHKIVKVPTYESIFMLFNFKQPQLAEKDFRGFLAQAIRSTGVSKLLVDESLYPLNQFTPTGVFGFNTSLDTSTPTKPNPLPEKTFLTLGLTEQNKKIGEIIQTNLAPLNIVLDLKILSQDELATAVREGTTDLLILGWRYDLGSDEGFFTRLVHTPSGKFGELNGIGYSSSATDKLIEQAVVEGNTKKRLQLLQDAMKKVVVDDVIGVPLLGTRRLYAVMNDFNFFTPRMDGLVMLSNVNH